MNDLEPIFFTSPHHRKPFEDKRLFKGGGGGQSTTTQNIPEELKPLATAYTDKAIELGEQDYQGYDGQRFAGINDIQSQGLNNIIGRAQNGSETINNAESALNQMMSGTSNPYLDSMVNRAQDNVKSNFMTSAINSGSFGNSGLQDQFAKNLSDTASNMYGNAYAGDRANQMQAIGMSPTFGNQAYDDARQMLNAGQIFEDKEQQGLDFNYQNYLEEQNLPYKQLGAMSGVFGSNLGGSSTTTQSGGGGK